MIKRLLLCLVFCLLFSATINSQQSTITLFYVATAVDSNGAESSFSNEATAVLSATHNVVDLSWVASTSTVSGYNMYRGRVSGGPYSKLNSTLISGLTFVDTYTFPAPPTLVKTVVP